ncbi:MULTISPECIES: ABC transporter permease [unclassified Mesotoga]|uniref:ABC transporter permease n=1 Tax=unclassified Mesotoga TaxID=1184398 RepID=UPI000D94F27A|nr:MULTISPECIES: ABC transporter permease [unclassified Mesotoga]MDD3460732.1 ABC transporter permease [Mesotoga sp.]PXF34714.1 peptide ABC transporter permease [Mesotoga sp. SC_NapDC]
MPAKRKSEFRKIMKKYWTNGTAVLGTCLLIFFIIIAIFAPQIAGVNEMGNNYQIPRVSWSSKPIAPSAEHPFGVIGGRDVFYGVIWGTRTAFRLGLIITSFSALIGVIVGSISAYFGGWVDEILMRITDIFLSIPFLVAAMVMTTILGKGLDKVIIALIIFGWMSTARLIRGNILQAREEQYVLAAKALGQKDWKIIIKHILPNTIFPVVVQMSMRIGSYVITAAGLSFLGVGAEPGYADWGTILSYSRNWMTMLDQSWFAIVFPGTAMVLFVLAWNLVGDALRDIFDPRMRS